ncbi:MAG TPA: PAS domain S-box protein [Deltaproteobacteria bacterium]|jgi:PAS domain S-box-containing protein|nr:PAS domain S-box protein [Deltaproteobacteria bacterium]HOI06663.1 PAS domain S-box protein [Deltaproteobacteria bacterium]
MKYDGMTREQLVEELTEAHQLISDMMARESVHREALRKLRMSEARHQIYFSHSNDVMFTYDVNLVLLYVSPNVERILGYLPEELQGKPFYDLGILHPADLNDAMEDALSILTGKLSYRTIHRFFAKDGSVRFGELCIIPFEEQGKVSEIISVARDITERIERERLFKESQETARVLLDAFSDSSAVLDVSGSVIAINEPAARRLGKDARELMGTCLFDRFPPESAAQIRTAFERVVSTSEPVQLVAEPMGKPIIFRMYPIRDALGKVSRVAVNAKQVPEADWKLKI